MAGTKKPELAAMVKLNFDRKGRVVFYIEGHGRWGLRTNEKTERLRALLEDVYKATVSLEVEL